MGFYLWYKNTWKGGLKVQAAPKRYCNKLQFCIDWSHLKESLQVIYPTRYAKTLVRRYSGHMTMILFVFDLSENKIIHFQYQRLRNFIKNWLSSLMVSVSQSHHYLLIIQRWALYWQTLWDYYIHGEKYIKSVPY